MERQIRIDGLSNLRDVGGYPTVDGRHIRWRTLLRSGSLHGASPDTERRLREEGVRTIIDLRRPEEVKDRPDISFSAHAVEYLNVPLYDITFATDPAIRSQEAMLCRVVDQHQQGIARAVQTIAGSQPATLVHCTGGLHRTGLVTAFCLAVAGVPEEVIAEDFALSEAYLGPALEEARQRMIARGGSPERAQWFAASKPETMRHTLAHVDQTYGGVSAYLSAAGVTQAQQEALRAMLVE